MSPEPDLAGFVEAQNRLRGQVGMDVIFEIPVAAVYPVGTALDPESGEPYDPTVVPESGGGTTEVTVRASTVFRPIRTGGEDFVEAGAAGVTRDRSAAVDVAIGDFPQIAGATHFTISDMRFRITEEIPDGMTAAPDRRIIYGEAL